MGIMRQQLEGQEAALGNRLSKLEAAMDRMETKLAGRKQYGRNVLYKHANESKRPQKPHQRYIKYNHRRN